MHFTKGLRRSRIFILFLFLFVGMTEAMESTAQNTVTYKFPKDFMWSTSTSAFQVEGATKEGGRGPSIWDTFQIKNGHIEDGSNADVACDSYHKYKEDVKIMKDLGVTAYRFSISWPRILPAGLDKKNPEGIQYYHDLIDELLKNGITPMVTLFHWDLPQSLQDQGGWLNPNSPQWMTDYAKVCFEEYGKKVPYWITVNEPRIHTLFGYGHYGAMHAPGMRTDGDWAEYLVGHNMILAHGKTYRLYEENYKNRYGGKVGIVNILTWMEPLTECEEDVKAADFALNLYFGQYTDPVFFGDYPASLKEYLNEHATLTGRLQSILPEFTEEEKKMLKGSTDFLGINFYLSLMIRPLQANDTEGILPKHWNVYASFGDKWTPVGPAPQYIHNTPFGLYKGLKYVKQKYGDVQIIITENGCMDTPGEGLNDTTRVEYLSGHLAAVGRAISEGVNVIGYSVWSLMDNFEWASGYALRFGIHQVDFNDPNRTRTPKLSAKLYQKTVKSNEITVSSDVATSISPLLPSNSPSTTPSFTQSVGSWFSGVGVAIACTLHLMSEC